MSSPDAILSTDLSGLVHRGNVRDTYRVADGVLMMIATDRISAFDVIMNDPVPHKGVLLAQMSAFWFRNVIGDIIDNHMIGMAGEMEVAEKVGRVGALAHLPDAWRDRPMIYERALEHASKRGMILVDTKFEFGFVDGKLTLIDEVLTPDSSRFWEADDWKPGSFPPAYDKQHLREWLTESGWNRPRRMSPKA